MLSQNQTSSRRALAPLLVSAVLLTGLALPASAQLSTLYFAGDTGSTQLVVEELSSTTTGRILLRLQNNGATNMQFVDTSINGTTWQLISDSNSLIPGFSISLAGTGRRELTLDNNGNLTVAGTVSGSSSRALKENFTSLDPREILGRAVALPVSTWNYKRDDDGLRHIGPMAEDFHAAFGVGSDNEHISFADSFGVALAAIQGLDQVVAEDGRAKDAEIQALRERVGELEALVRGLVESARE